MTLFIVVDVRYQKKQIAFLQQKLLDFLLMTSSNLEKVHVCEHRYLSPLG